MNNSSVITDQRAKVRKATPLVILSGVTGLIFAIIANEWPATVVTLDPVLAGFIQISINSFVFYSNFKLLQAKGGWISRTFGTCGVIIPVIMATITIVRVIVPWIVSLIT